MGGAFLNSIGGELAGPRWTGDGQGLGTAVSRRREDLLGQKAFDCAGSDAVGMTVKGPTAADDVADITVKKDGSVTVDSNAHGSFSGTGGTLHSKSGFDLNADLKSADGKTTHASGSLNC